MSIDKNNRAIERSSKWDQEIDKWDQYYGSLQIGDETEETRSFGKELLKKIGEILPDGGYILEAGCGGGWQSLAIARDGKYKISLLDFSSEALNYAKKVFEQAQLEAKTILDNFLNKGKPEYDLVFNAGVFEHYTFEEQVELLKGMASRSKKFVMVIVPNRLCYWYWLWRINATGKGLWTFGKEVPSVDLSKLFESAGLQFIGQSFMAAGWTESFIKLIPELDDQIRQLILEIHRLPVIDPYQKSYLVAGLGCVLGECPDKIQGWDMSPIQENFDTAVLQSTIADMLAAKIFSDAQYVQNINQINSFLVSKDEALTKLRVDLDVREQQVSELETLLRIIKEESEAILIAHQHEEETLLSAHQAEMDAIWSAKEAEVKRRDAELNVLSKQLGESQIKSGLLQYELDNIHHSRMWKLVQQAWRVRQRLIPSGSRRARFARASVERTKGLLKSTGIISIAQGLKRSLSSVKRGRTVPAEHLPDLEAGFMASYLYKKADYSKWLSDIQNNDPANVAKINDILYKKSYKGIVVYPHAVHWEPVQRPQQILIEMGQRGYLCFFCEAHQPEMDLIEITDNVYVITGEKYLLYPLQNFHVLVLCTWMYQMPFAEALPSRYLWYDLIDKIEIFSLFDDDMQKMHRDVVKIADLVTYSGRKLKEFVKERKDAAYLPNGVRIDDFTGTSEELTDPKMAEILSRGKPTIGYYGALAEWVDLNIFRELAERHPEWDLVIIGKAWVDITIIENVPNIHYLGPLPYSELPKYANQYDVGIIPFMVNELTDCVSPIKLFEYCALGIPIVTTPFYEVTQYQESFIKFASDVAEFSQAISECLQDSVRTTARIDGPDFAQNHQWATRIEMVEKLAYHSWQGLKCLANYTPNRHLAVMTETFFHYDGQGFYAGGGERYLIDLGNILAKMNIKMSIYQYGAYPWIRKYKDIDVISLAPRHDYLKNLTRDVIVDFNKLFYLANLERSVSNIYSPFYDSWPISLHPSIGISHGVAWDHYYATYDNGIKFWDTNRGIIEASQKCDWMVSVDTNTANWFQTINFEAGQNIRYIPNYVDIDQFHPREGYLEIGEKIIILYPRRLYRARGLYLLLAVMDDILENYPNVEIHFVGRGFEEDTRHVVSKQQKWDERVQWYALSPDEMPGAYQKADISLIPTLYSEGTSLSCLEALASGNAVIATRIGGLTNLVINEHNGLLIEPQEDALKTAIISLLENPEKMVSFKENGLNVARAFSKQIWEARWTELLNQMLNAVKPRQPLAYAKTKLVDIYMDASNLDYLYALLAQLLPKDILVYIRTKKINTQIIQQSYQRLQFLDWYEQIETIPDLVIADADSYQQLKHVDYVFKNNLIEDCFLITTHL